MKKIYTKDLKNVYNRTIFQLPPIKKLKFNKFYFKRFVSIKSIWLGLDVFLARLAISSFLSKQLSNFTIQFSKKKPFRIYTSNYVKYIFDYIIVQKY